MFLAILLLNVFHPGRVLVGPDSEFPKLTRKQKKEMKREEKEEKRRRKAGKKAGRKGMGVYEGDGVMLREMDTRDGRRYGEALA